MAIFMDRHDLGGTTAAEIAEAHRKDLEIQDQYGVRFLTYWFDQQRGTTFCLVDAPDAEAVRCVHRDAHGHVPGDIMEVSLSAVEAFLGRITDPAPVPQRAEAAIDGGHRTIMFTDIVGSTEMTARLGDRMATEIVRAHDSLVRRALAQFAGRQVKHTGDGIMASFDSTRAAVDCAKDIQRAFAQFNRENAQPIRLRIGMDCGDPIEDSDDLFGSSVQLASRLCGEADGDQIFVSENVLKEYGSADAFAQRGERVLKGFPEPVPAYECVWRVE